MNYRNAVPSGVGHTVLFPGQEIVVSPKSSDDSSRLTKLAATY